MLLSTSTHQADPTKFTNICGRAASKQLRYFKKLTIVTVSLFGLPAYQLHRVQQVLNAAARMIFGGKKQDNITPLLVKLHWLSVVKRVRFKICLTFYKSLNGSSPEYISEFLKPVTDLHRRSTLRSAMHDQLLVPMVTSEFGKRSFAFAGPSCWNQLPDHVRQSPSVDTDLWKLCGCTVNDKHSS